MPHGPFSTVGPRALIRAKHVTELQDALIDSPTFDDMTASVDGLVEDAIASDVIVQAAISDAITDEDIPGQVETAVDDEIAGRDLLEGGDIVEDDVIFAIVDEDGRRTWIEAAPDGGLTTHTVSKIEEHITGAVEQDTDITGLTFAVVDEDGRRTWLEADADGKPSTHALTLIGAGLGEVDSGLTFPSDDWAHWGDSLTSGGSTSFPTELATLTGQNHYNGGISGQGVDQIAGRQGGVPPRVTLTGDELPSSGAVTLTDITYTPLSNSTSRLGYIAGVEGTLAQDGSGVLTFTRSAAGDAVEVEPGAMFTPYHGTIYRDRIVTLWVGRNDFLSDSISFILSRIQAMIDYLTPTVKRVIVMEILPSNVETTGTANRITLDTLNLAIQTTFRQYYVDIAAWLRTSAAATAAGITFDATDTTDIANGITPTSLRSDGIHPNDDGNVAIAYRVHQEAQLRGWIA